MEGAELQLKGVDGAIVTFPRKFAQISKKVADLNLDEVMEFTDTGKAELEFVKKYYELYDFNEESIQITKPLKSGEFKDHVDEKCYELLKGYLQDIHGLEPHVKLAFALECEKYKDALTCCYAVQFWLGEKPTPEQLKEYADKFKIHEMTEE